MRQQPSATATRLFDILAAQGRRQDWLAEQVGCSQAYVSMMKSGQRPLPDWFVERAARVLGVPVEVLLFDATLSSERTAETEADRVA